MSGTIKINFSDNLVKLNQVDKLRIELRIYEWIFGEIDSHSEYLRT